jgi:hypothetical protein
MIDFMIRHNQKYLDAIYKFYPKDIYPGNKEYLDSPEYAALLDLQELCLKNTERFDTLRENIAKERKVNVMERANYSHIAHFYLPEKIGYAKLESCTIIISEMLNVFSVYLKSEIRNMTTLEGIRSKEEFEMINSVTEHVTSIYPEYEPFDMDFYNTRVPGVMANPRYNDYATYYECLISDHIY